MDGSPVRRNAVRATIPHVVTQWETAHSSGESIHTRGARARANSEHLRRIAFSPTERSFDSPKTKSSYSLGTPENDRWDFGSIRHIRQPSEIRTPVSAVESIFELPENQVHGSPNSSVHSSFIAELEDTSSVALQKRLVSPVSATVLPLPSPRPREHSMDFKCVGTTPRAVLKVVDETLASIEAINLQLLNRAIAAEESTKLLLEQNNQLQLKIKQCNHHHRPKTAPSQPPSTVRVQHRHTASCTPSPTPLSAFNTQIDSLVLSKPNPPANRKPEPNPTYKPCKPRPPPPFPPARKFSFQSSHPITAPSNIDLAPPHPDKPLPLSLSPKSPHEIVMIKDISSPIPGSVFRNEVTYAGTPVSFAVRPKHITLEEARRRAKPLPPLGPMSPSVVRGCVEIGGYGECGVDGREREGEKEKRGLSGFFKRCGRKEGGAF